MYSETHELLIDSIFSLRSWCIDNLPIENSLIAYDLILLLSIHNYSQGQITVKQLFASVPYSYTAVRSHYLRLLEDGWIELHPDHKDKRIKYVRPTQKLVKMMNLYATTTKRLFTNKDKAK